MSDYISLHGTMWAWVQEVATQLEEWELIECPASGWVEPKWLAYFIVLCQEFEDIPEFEDTPESFPFGKWAAIQHLKWLLITAVQREMQRIRDDSEADE